MTDQIPAVTAPAHAVPEHAIAFGTAGMAATAVDASHPLPVAMRQTAAGSTPLAGSTAASTTIGPFLPDLGRAIWLTLSGSWAGTVQVLRSIDGGTTKLPLTVGGQTWASFTANAQEPVGEENSGGASWWLSIALSSGTLAYGLAQ